MLSPERRHRAAQLLWIPCASPWLDPGIEWIDLTAISCVDLSSSLSLFSYKSPKSKMGNGRRVCRWPDK